jgi:hypothetical protein
MVQGMLRGQRSSRGMLDHMMFLMLQSGLLLLLFFFFLLLGGAAGYLVATTTTICVTILVLGKLRRCFATKRNEMSRSSC